jgi:hypothetical protein
VSKLFNYQFSFEFEPSCQNAAADTLSHRHEEDVTLHALSIPTFDLLDAFHVEADTLSEVSNKRAEITADTAGLDWALKDNMVVRRGRLFLSGITNA